MKTLSEMNAEFPNYTPNAGDFIYVETAGGAPRAVKGADLANFLQGQTIPEASLPAVGSANVGISVDTNGTVGIIEWATVKQQSETFWNVGGAAKLNVPSGTPGGNISKVSVSLRLHFTQLQTTVSRFYITKNGDLVNGRVGYGEGLGGVTIQTGVIAVIPTDYFEVFLLNDVGMVYKATECDFGIEVVERAGA